MADLSSWLALYAGPLAAGATVAALCLLGSVVWLILRLRRLEHHYRVLTTGTDGGSLGAILEEHVREVRAATERTRALELAMHEMEQASCLHVQRVGFLRFNPFRETGGDQSFVLALADGNGNGAVISALHSRDLTRIYGKPLAGWQSTYPLTDEEQQVIGKARG